MTTPNELTLVEKPLLAYVKAELGYRYLPPDEALSLRGSENRVILRQPLIEAIARINDIPESAAVAIVADLERITDNQRWLSVLRGNYSRKLPGDETHRPIRIIDLDQPANNDFVVTNQLETKGLSWRIPDVVVYVNGIPLVVIEAKSSIGKQDVFDAISDIAVYEKELPRLFQTNLFNIATNGLSLRYGATGAPKEFWSAWRDPWPRPASDFEGEPMRKGLWSLLEKSRLIDLLAHFVVFETDASSGTTIKKMCRYQQFRAVNKLVERVAAGKHTKGLVWHTQGSGKSLTMVYATLKLKFHHGISSDQLENPNILVITDRRDLDTQITKTFLDCGVPNPEHAQSIGDLRERIAGNPKGKVVLSTIFKAYGSTEAIHNSGDWIVLVDEAHRTQERDLGAYLRATFPDGRFFGFTGTPVKTNDLDTRRNFGIEGEDYLDRYGIEDAVADGATVPIRYMSRMALWDLDAAKLDVLFDQEFAGLPEELRNELKARGVTKGDLSRFEPRIALITYDIWTHFKKNVQPDGMKAQIVAVDRRACTIYKRWLDHVITQELLSQGVPEKEARARAEARSVCIYSDGGKEDLKAGNEDLKKYYLDEEAEKGAIRRFKDPGDPLSFLIVCNKLLTGFDAPIEQAMYLDNYLTEHNLLQAIARTNRLYGSRKDHGLIVDYIGVTKSLKKALSSYKPADVKDAMGGDSLLVDRLRDSHKAAMAFLKGAVRVPTDPEEDAKNGVAAIGTEDVWYQFRPAASAFLSALAAVGSNPVRLEYKDDALYVTSVVAYGKLKFEQEAEIDFKAYSEKIRGMLKDHLRVTGLETLLTLPSISDPSFWYGLSNDVEEKDIQTAALKKASALKKELVAKSAANPAQYATLSARIQQLIKQFQNQQIAAAELYKHTYELAVELVRKEVEFEQTGLDQATHGFYAILTQDLPSSAKTASSRRFTEKGIIRLVEALSNWKHDRCGPEAEAFHLGGGSQTKAREMLELLEQVANAPMPKFVTEQEGADSYVELAERVVRAPDRLIRASDPDAEDLGPWTAWVFLGVEPLLFKALALLEPDRAKSILKKRKGLTTLITELKKAGRSPYMLDLSPQEFESLDGWATRSSYDNAVRDVVPVRIDEAHKAPRSDRGLWYSAMVMILGVIQQNADDLAHVLDKLELPKDVHEARKAGELLTEDLSEREATLRATAEELRELFTSDQTAPVNWQKNKAVQQELEKATKRVLMKAGFAGDQRKALISAVTDYARQHFSKIRE